MKLRIDLVFSLKTITLALVLIAIFFLTLDAIVYSFNSLFASDFVDLVDITLEGNLPTWFSSTQLLLVGLCAYLIGQHRRLQNGNGKAIAWFVIAAFFAYMGIDDASQLHERVSTIIADVSLGSNANIPVPDMFRNFPSYYWLILFLPVFASVALFMIVFLFKEFSDREPMQLFLVGITFYVGAVGLDYFDGIDRNYDIIVNNTLFLLDDARHVFRAVEEFIEMVGTIFILAAFLQHLHSIQSLTPGAAHYARAESKS